MDRFLLNRAEASLEITGYNRIHRSLCILNQTVSRFSTICSWSSAASSPATFSGLLRCGRVGTHAVERRGPVGIALCSTSAAGFPALHLSATFRHGPLVAPGLESAIL